MSSSLCPCAKASVVRFCSGEGGVSSTADERRATGA